MTGSLTQGHENGNAKHGLDPIMEFGAGQALKFFTVCWNIVSQG